MWFPTWREARFSGLSLAFSVISWAGIGFLPRSEIRESAQGAIVRRVVVPTRISLRVVTDLTTPRFARYMARIFM